MPGNVCGGHGDDFLSISVGFRALARPLMTWRGVRGRLERYYRATLVLSFGGGANEIQRDIIGITGLGLPREKRRR